VLSIGLAVAFAFVIRTYMAEPFVVDGISMQNTLQNGERVLVNKMFNVRNLRYGQIVVFSPPIAGAGDYIKRVIATGGQSEWMTDGQVYVDGRKMPQPFLHWPGASSTQDHYSMQPFVVPKGDIYVLGDHRAESEDSRIFGPVRLSSVYGTAFWVIWPLNRFGPIQGD
jgi:signal peptidase I